MKIYHVESVEKSLFKSLLSVNVGWSHEPRGKEGISHFLEHALFLGNETYPDPDSHTAKFGVTLNGETLADRTIFFFNSLPEDGSEILDILLSLVFQPSFEEEKVEEEKKSKIIPAIVKESDYYPWELAYEWARNLIFEWDFRRSMGTVDSLENAGIDELLDWHEKYYHRTNVVLLTSEPVDVSIIGPGTGEIPERQRIKYDEKEIVLKRDIENAEIVYAFPFENYDIRALILSTILGNYPTSLLWREFHRDAYIVDSMVEWHWRGGFFLYLGANVPPEKIHEKILHFIESLSIKPEDMYVAKKILSIEIMERAQSPMAMKYLLALDPELKFGGHRGILEEIENVEISELRDYAHEILDTKFMRKVVVR